jgi:hypothetical protein
VEIDSVPRQRMNPIAYRKIGAVVVGVCILLVFSAGCMVSEYGTGRDIMIFKVDAGGMEEWQTVIDTGGDDKAKTIIQTKDGGYLVGGEVWPWRGDRSSIIFKIDGNGSVVWNATGAEEEPVSSITQTTEGTIVAISGSQLLFFDQRGKLLDDVSYMKPDDVLRSVARTTDGGFVAVGTAGGDALVLKRDRNLNEKWRETYGADGQDDAWIVIQTSDGEYLVSGITEPPGRNDYERWVMRLSDTGGLLWMTTLIETAKGVDFMEEAPGGGCTVIYHYQTVEEGQYVQNFVDATIDHEGNVLAEKAIDAGRPVIKTTDQGYVSGTLTYTITQFLIIRDRVGVPHITKLGSNGSQEWDTALNTTFELSGTPVSVIQTSDGGYAYLVNRQNYPKEPR